MVDQILTINEVAGRLRLKPRTVRRWVFLRKIEYVKVGGTVRIPESEIKRIIDQGTVQRLPRDMEFAERVTTRSARTAQYRRSLSAAAAETATLFPRNDPHIYRDPEEGLR
jgi:excisionase family DNA binding protein